MRPSRAQLADARGTTIPDLIGPGLRLLFVGINPGLWSAAVGAHFARPGNRFYPALHRAGITDREVNAAEGYRRGDREHLVTRGVGITNLVGRATARADELSTDELRAGIAVLRGLVDEHRPAVVAVLGITAYRAAFGAPSATTGQQSSSMDGAACWVLPNPSGLNAHENVDSLAAAYRRAAEAAGVVAA